MRLSCSRIRAGGFTLLEVLAVVVILSLVASVTLLGLASASDEAVMREARSALMELDAKARLFSRTGRCATLGIDESGAIEVRVNDTERNLIAQAAIAPQVLMTIDTVDSFNSEIQFDRLGTSVDYRIVIQSVSGIERWRVCGLTGWFSEDREP